jgi:hypothetical protein
MLKRYLIYFFAAQLTRSFMRLLGKCSHRLPWTRQLLRSQRLLALYHPPSLGMATVLTRPCLQPCVFVLARAQWHLLLQRQSHPPTASSLLKRAAPVFIHQRATAISTARWVSALMSDWDHNVRQGTFTSDHPGYRLADAMATYVSAIFSQRRHLLANDDAYRARSRDPVQAALSSVSASARPQFNLVSCSLSVPLPLAHSRPDASPDSTALPTSLRT